MIEIDSEISEYDVSVPLRGFWYAGLPSSDGQRHVNASCFSPLTGILVRRQRKTAISEVLYLSFQSPYGDFGTPAEEAKQLDSISYQGFSPLTGILVRRRCLPVPAPRLGSQAIFSNLGLFSPFRLTRVKNKNQAMAIIGLVMPFFAGLKIFKPRRFLTLK